MEISVNRNVLQVSAIPSRYKKKRIRKSSSRVIEIVGVILFIPFRGGWGHRKQEKNIKKNKKKKKKDRQRISRLINISYTRFFNIFFMPLNALGGKTLGFVRIWSQSCLPLRLLLPRYYCSAERRGGRIYSYFSISSSSPLTGYSHILPSS